MDANRYAAAGLALSGAVALYTLGSIPQGTVAQNWDLGPALPEAAAPAQPPPVFPAPLLRTPESPAKARPTDGLSLVVPDAGLSLSGAYSEAGEVVVPVGLASVGPVGGVNVERLLERYPWLAPIGSDKLSFLLGSGEIEKYGVWGACGRLGLYSQCLLACQNSGTGCRPE